MHQYDHRWATYDNETNTRDLTENEKKDPITKLPVKIWDYEWLIGYRCIARTTDERTCIFGLMPLAAVGHSMNLIFSDKANTFLIFSNFNSLPFDYFARQKIGGTNLTHSYIKQFPVLPPEKYTDEDIKYIKSRILELTYTAYDLKPFALDMGYEGEPFERNPERRALLRAELDAYYAKLYGLSREELLYILDPQEVFGEDYPGETFRVLKEREIRGCGEYKTKRLVMEAFDKL